jgi:hypothetical protein
VNSWVNGAERLGGGAVVGADAGGLATRAAGVGVAVGVEVGVAVAAAIRSGENSPAADDRLLARRTAAAFVFRRELVRTTRSGVAVGVAAGRARTATRETETGGRLATARSS